MPPLGGMPPDVQAAFRAIASWARVVDSAAVQPQAPVQRTVSQPLTASAGREPSAMSASQYASPPIQNDLVIRSILSNSNLTDPIKMNSSVVFQAGNSSTGVGIGSGGILGINSAWAYAGYDGYTFGIASADGSFFFGPRVNDVTDPARKQIIFDVSSGIFQLGRDIVVKSSSGNKTLETVVTNAANGASAYGALVTKLDKNASYVLEASSEFKTSGYDGGNGMNFTNNGIVAKKSGAITFSISATGDAVFKGDISGATGNFAGNISAATGTFSGAISAKVTASSALGNVAVLGIPSIPGYVATAGISDFVGVWGRSNSAHGYGTYGENTASTGWGLVGYAPSGVDIVALGSKKIAFGGSAYNIRHDGSNFRFSDSNATDAYMPMITSYGAADGAAASLGGKIAAGASASQAGWLIVKAAGSTIYLPYWV